jgi:predicted aspartyl protease
MAYKHTIPEPHNALPWTQRDEASVIRDANGQVVSFVMNVPFVMALVRQHQAPLVAAQLEVQLGGAQDSIRNLSSELKTAKGLIEALKAEQKKPEPAKEVQ